MLVDFWKKNKVEKTLTTPFNLVNSIFKKVLKQFGHFEWMLIFVFGVSPSGCCSTHNRTCSGYG